MTEAPFVPDSASPLTRAEATRLANVLAYGPISSLAIDKALEAKGWAYIVIFEGSASTYPRRGSADAFYAHDGSIRAEWSLPCAGSALHSADGDANGNCLYCGHPRE